MYTHTVPILCIMCLHSHLKCLSKHYRPKELLITLSILVYIILSSIITKKAKELCAAHNIPCQILGMSFLEFFG